MHLLNDVVILLGELGESDCEEIGSGFFNQPVNAISSGAYTLLGLWLVGRAIRGQRNDRVLEILFGLALAAVGIGSIAFHGPVPPGARWLHDVTIAAVLAIIVARNVAVLRDSSTAAAVAGAGLITALVGAVMAFAPEAGNILSGVVGVGAVVTEVVVYRAGIRRFSPRVARLLGATAVLLIAAGIINVLGRTGGPLCDPDSYFQGHAVWHLLTAAAFMVYGYTAFGPKPD